MADTEQARAEGELPGSSTKIDMSLDDIIKLQKEGTDPRPSTNPAGQNERKRNLSFRSNRFFRGPPRNQQGLGKPKTGFKQQRYPTINTRNRFFGPVTRQRAAGFLNGISPLNRPSTPSTKNSGQGQAQKGQQVTNRFQASVGPAQGVAKRNSFQNRKLQLRAGQSQLRASAANQNKNLTQQVKMNPGQRQLNTKRWQNSDGFGTTLTVSVPNPKANRASQANKTEIKQPGGRFRKMADQPTRPPKGVPLRFNFRAMGNHTKFTLNERFSTLTIKGRFTAARRGGRTVTIA